MSRVEETTESTTPESSAQSAPQSANDFHRMLRALPDRTYDPHDYLSLIEKLGTRLFTRDLDQVITHAEAIARSGNAQEIIQSYVELILSTRDREKSDMLWDDRLVTAASNAITILNYGNIVHLFDFEMAHVKNWSACRFPEADLSLACFDTCDMHGVDLSRACLFGATLGANFQEAKLDHPKLFRRFGSDSASEPLNYTALRDNNRNCIMSRSYPHEVLHESQVMPEFISSSGTTLVRYKFPDYSIEVRKLPGGERLMEGLNAVCTCAAVSPDERFLACALRESNELHIYELASGACVFRWCEGFAGNETQEDYDANGNDTCGKPIITEVRTLAYSADSSLLAVVEASVICLDDHAPCEFCLSWMDELRTTSTITVLSVAEAHAFVATLTFEGPVASVAFSPDRTLLAVTGGQTLACWDIRTQQLQVESSFDKQLGVVSFTPDSQALVFSYGEDTLKVRPVHDVQREGQPAACPQDSATTALDWPQQVSRKSRVTASELMELFESGESAENILRILPVLPLRQFPVNPWQFFCTVVELPDPRQAIYIFWISSEYYEVMLVDGEYELVHRSEVAGLLEWLYQLACHIKRLNKT